MKHLQIDKHCESLSIFYLVIRILYLLINKTYYYGFKILDTQIVAKIFTVNVTGHLTTKHNNNLAWIYFLDYSRICEHFAWRHVTIGWLRIKLSAHHKLFNFRLANRTFAVIYIILHSGSGDCISKINNFETITYSHTTMEKYKYKFRNLTDIDLPKETYLVIS